MRGLVILGAVGALAAAGFFYVLRPDDRDLEVLEQRVAQVLDQCERRLLEAQRDLDALRSIRPNVLGLEREFERLRVSLEKHRWRLADFERSRPDSREERGSYTEARRAARREAETLLAGIEDFASRTELGLTFLREVQPEVQRILHAFGLLWDEADRLRAAGRLPPDLAARIEALREDVRKKRSLARTAFDTATRDREQGRILVETARAEVERALVEVEALRARLKKMGTGGG